MRDTLRLPGRREMDGKTEVDALVGLVYCFQLDTGSKANQTAAAAACLTEFSADLIRRETCNSTGVRFRRILEIRPAPDSRVGYPSIPIHGFFLKAIRRKTTKSHREVIFHLYAGNSPPNQIQ